MTRGLFIVCVLSLACGHGEAPAKTEPSEQGSGTSAAREPAQPVQPVQPAQPRPKPAIAILGLEVFDNGTGKAPDTIKAAGELTAALRDRAKAGTSSYVLAPGSDKELIDVKMLSNCQSEAPACLAKIGGDFGADVLLYGKIEQTPNGYRISLKLLNVSRKQLLSSVVDSFPLAEATGVELAAHAKAYYAKLSGTVTGE